MPVPFTSAQHLQSYGAYNSNNTNTNTNGLSYTPNDRLVFHPASSNRSSFFSNVPRKIIPLPVNKRARVYKEGDDEQLDLINHAHPHAHPRPQLSHQQQLYFSHAHPDAWTPPMSPQPWDARPAPRAAVLSPCHICRRKPTRKSDLDSYADCLGCGRRTCFVCIRECQGWLSTSSDRGSEVAQKQDLSASFTMHDVDDDGQEQELYSDGTKADGKGCGQQEEGWRGRGHRSMICSQCCVERGSEGDVVCLGCLAGMEGA